MGGLGHDVCSALLARPMKENHDCLACALILLSQVSAASQTRSIIQLQLGRNQNLHDIRPVSNCQSGCMAMQIVNSLSPWRVCAGFSAPRIVSVQNSS